MINRVLLRGRHVRIFLRDIEFARCRDDHIVNLHCGKLSVIGVEHLRIPFPVGIASPEERHCHPLIDEDPIADRCRLPIVLGRFQRGRLRGRGFGIAVLRGAAVWRNCGKVAPGRGLRRIFVFGQGRIRRDVLYLSPRRLYDPDIIHPDAAAFIHHRRQGHQPFTKREGIREIGLNVAGQRTFEQAGR